MAVPQGKVVDDHLRGDAQSKEGSAVSRGALMQGLSFYVSVIMALLGASERRARLALHEVLVVVGVIQRRFQALLVCAELIAARC